MNKISNLLRYNINDIQYKYHIKNATISAQHNFPTHDAHVNQGKLSQHTEQPQLRQDSSAFFASIGLHKMSDLMDKAAEKGRQAVLEATANYGKIADQMAEIDKGVTPAQIYHQKLLEQTKTSLVVKPAAQIRFSYTPGEVSTQYTPPSVSIDWNVDRAIRRYAPADFDMDIYQMPTINFLYQGDFQYVPESTTPGFNRLV
ncbi:DUF6470 family protein [Oscillospiraceae bacterium LTW-04]|nr:DUF6470 family protein [Oscillospiraceae bacterium MB24-C1]